ncbi:hypothetical protein VNO77_18459 [Canavalia gladiata]|uniref:Benzyl alcohol O-benzoyltransferase n=1 Tax=Canavalia gladiata TaxID=3824 RepID=A0AAN9LLI8_CANGL
MALSSSSLMFTVRRCEPELVAPAVATPHELKLLSDIDDQEALRFYIPMIYIYRNEPSMEGKDPVEVIRGALAQTLVFYYPFAGRLREGPNRKLMVDCIGEGVIFIEADADVTLDQFGDSVIPLFPCIQQLLYDVPASDGIINTPLLFVQVTRLKCGGFILTGNVNHTMIDGPGVSQFMNAWAEMARGAHKPSVLPVWRREIFLARDPPRITRNHREYEQIEDTITSKEDEMVLRSFFFSDPPI